MANVGNRSQVRCRASLQPDRLGIGILPSEFASGSVAADLEQVADRILHPVDAIPVFPAIGQSIAGGFTAYGHFGSRRDFETIAYYEPTNDLSVIAFGTQGDCVIDLMWNALDWALQARS